MEWKKGKRTGNFRGKVGLRLRKILEESKLRQTITDQSSSSGETPVNKTGHEISEETEEVIVNADFEDEHNWDIEMEADNPTPEMGVGPHLESELRESSLRHKLREWAITHGISHLALKDLLQIWNHHLPNHLRLPSDPSALYSFQ
ncbi:hypothetical protein JTB14_017842 [Gonioctena quinquepunctata]|nr:hypothetical protein JTB14_017842 [Gonioctena quinquepunctata]